MQQKGVRMEPGSRRPTQHPATDRPWCAAGSESLAVGVPSVTGPPATEVTPGGLV